MLVGGVETYQAIEQVNDLSAFVKEYSPLVNRLVVYIKKTIPDTLEYDDLLQSGLTGLLEAKKDFDPTAGASFSTYATMKVRYAIYDFIRKTSGITRDIGQNIKKITQATDTLGAGATSLNIAQELGVSSEQYSKMAAQINTYKSISVYDAQRNIDIKDDSSGNPLYIVESQNFKKALKELIQTLPKREQAILALYYNEQLSFKQVADILSITEARVSQIHSLVLDKIKRRVKDLAAVTQ